MKVNKFITIYKDIAQQIEGGRWKAEEILPSEHELTAQYGTSRETVRKALHMLAQNGYIQKIRGKGSVVLNREKNAVSRFGPCQLQGARANAWQRNENNCTQIRAGASVRADPKTAPGQSG